MKSDGKDEEKKTNIIQGIRWHRRRYRDRIWYISPEGWLALSFTLLTLGTSLLSAYYFVSDGSEPDIEIVFKLGAFLLFIGWGAFVFLVETVKSRNGARTSFRDPNPPFVGVSITPSPQPEWLSAVLLPESDQGWVLVEAEPWFEPNDEIAHPPVRVIPEKDGNDSRLSSSKKKRNRKKKNQNSEFDEPEQSNETPGQIEDQITIAEHPEGSNRDLQEYIKKNPNKKINRASDDDMPKESIQVSDHPKDSHQTFSHSKDSHQTFSHSKDSHQTFSHSKDSHQTFSHSKDSHQTFSHSKDSHQTFSHSKDSHQTFSHDKDSHPLFGQRKDSQTSGGVLPEKLDQTSFQTTISNPISSSEMPEHSKQPFTHLKVSNQASIGFNPEQSNKTSIQSKDSNTIYSDKPEQSVHTSNQPKQSNKTSGGMQAVDSYLVPNLDSRLSTSKKKNRRRKK